MMDTRRKEETRSSTGDMKKDSGEKAEGQRTENIFRWRQHQQQMIEEAGRREHATQLSTSRIWKMMMMMMIKTTDLSKAMVCKH